MARTSTVKPAAEVVSIETIKADLRKLFPEGNVVIELRSDNTHYLTCTDVKAETTNCLR